MRYGYASPVFLLNENITELFFVLFYEYFSIASSFVIPYKKYVLLFGPKFQQIVTFPSGFS